MSESPISVCMFSNLYPPVVSGSSTQTDDLSHELVRRGHNVIVITAKVDSESKEYEEADGVHVYRLPAIRLPRMPIALNFPWLSYTFTIGNLRRIQRIINRHNPDVLHLHNHMFDLALAAVLTHQRTGTPLVITIHTMIRHARTLYNLLLYPADRVLLKHCVIKQADVIICPDINIQEYVQTSFGKPSVALVPYGVDLLQPPPDEIVEQVRTKHHLEGKRVILSLGHVHEIRNRKDLIEALVDIRKVLGNVVLLIVGTVADSYPSSLARDLGVHPYVIFAGHVPHSEVSAYLALADLEAHWLNQDAAEKTSLGIASMEAMGAGKTVLAAANGDTYGAGVLQNGENIVLVEAGKPKQLAQTMIQLLGDQKRCSMIGERARHTIEEHFSWESVGSKTLDVYRSVQQKCGDQ